jgi:hypothetical protein
MHPRLAAALFAACAAAAGLIALWLAANRPDGYAPLLGGTLLFSAAATDFAVATWRGCSIGWRSSARLGISAALAGTLLWVLPL